MKGIPCILWEQELYRQYGRWWTARWFPRFWRADWVMAVIAVEALRRSLYLMHMDPLERQISTDRR